MAGTAFPSFAQDFDFTALRLVPLQDGGRIKPLDTFTRESVRLVTGHESFEGKSAMDLTLDWLTHPDNWDPQNFILVENLELRSLLGIPKEQKFVSPHFLLNHEGFMAYAKIQLRQTGKKNHPEPHGKRIPVGLRQAPAL